MTSLKTEFNNMDLPEQELDLIIGELDKYTVEYPPQYEIDSCVESLSMYIPKNKSLKMKLNRVVNNALLQMSYINKLYFVLSIFIFILTCEAAIKNDVDPYGVILFIAPIPFVVGLIEIFKGSENNMLELELSLKISAKEMVISRMMVIALFNIILNIIMCLLLYNSNLAINFVKINILWIVPFVWVNSIAFVIAKKVRSYYVSSLVITLWVAIITSLYSNKFILEKIIQINIWLYVTMILVGIILGFFVIKDYVQDQFTYFEYEV